MTESTCDLTQKSCKPCEGGVPPMTEDEIQKMLRDVEGWAFENGEITKTFTFKNYYETMAFVNALAWVELTMSHGCIQWIGMQEDL